MVSLQGAAELCQLNAQLAEALESLGWNVQRLGTLQGAESMVVDSVLAGARAAREEATFKWTDLTDLIYVCNQMAEVAWKSEGNSSGAELLEAGVEARSAAEKLEQQKGEDDRIMKIIPRRGKAKVMKWPTRLGKLLAVAGESEQLRHRAEEVERDRWINELASLMKEADLPAVAAGGWEGLRTVRIGKGRRASTLRKHVKTWTRVRSWLISAFGVPWPTHAAQFALYLESRAMEPCGKSIPVSIYKTLMFMEHAGEVQKEDMIQNDPALKNALEEIGLRLESEAMEPRKQAMHISEDCDGMGASSMWWRAASLHQGLCLVQTGENLGSHEVLWHHRSERGVSWIGWRGMVCWPRSHQDYWPGQTGEPGESVCEQACILEGARMAAGWLEALGAAGVWSLAGKEGLPATAAKSWPAACGQEDG